MGNEKANEDYVPLSCDEVDKLSREAFLEKLAYFYDEPEIALGLLEERYQKRYWKVGPSENYIKFFMAQQEAFIRRTKNNIAHKIDYLKIELDEGSPNFILGWGRVPPCPNLDQIEKIKTEPVYVYNPKTRK